MGITAGPAKTRLVLYVAGASARSRRAIENLQRIANRNPDVLEVEVVDIYQQPERTRDHQIIVAPTLVRDWPQPTRRLVGDLSDTQRVIQGLELGEVAA